MRIDEFDYELPAELIAQRPARRRDASRLLVLGPGGAMQHRVFAELPELLRAGDLLVLNDARVLPARVWARRVTGGRVELLFLQPVGPRRWRVLVRPARRVHAGEELVTDAGSRLRVATGGGRGERLIEVAAGVEPLDLLEREGRMPLPPYIRRPPPPAADPPARPEGLEALDRQRYQTVYAAVPGAVAAPTAGLHFTTTLLERLRDAGVQTASLTLHVGPGTFRRPTAETVEEHRMEPERYTLPPACAEAVNRARAERRRVIAVGTTVVRSLEYAARAGQVAAGEGEADLFIYPGYRFRAIDAMITNFHLPRSTPLLLVAALAGRARLLAAYREAVRRRYRFYSYGDAMLVLPADAAQEAGRA